MRVLCFNSPGICKWMIETRTGCRKQNVENYCFASSVQKLLEKLSVVWQKHVWCDKWIMDKVSVKVHSHLHCKCLETYWETVKNCFLETRNIFLLKKVFLILRKLVLFWDIFLFQVKFSCRWDKKIFLSLFFLFWENILIFSKFENVSLKLRKFFWISSEGFAVLLRIQFISES